MQPEKRPGRLRVRPQQGPARQPRLFYGWVIVAIAFVTLFLVIGTRFSLGVFYVAILDDYQ